MRYKVSAGLHIVEHNMNGEIYRKVLAEHLLSSILSTEYGEFIFKQEEFLIFNE